MEILQENEARVERFLVPRMARVAEAVRTQATEPRNPQGIRHALPNMTLAMLAGLLTGGTPRDAERHSQRLGLGKRGGKIADNTMWSLLAKADDMTWRPVLVQLNKDAKRRGQFSTGELGRHWTAVDGKYQTLDRQARRARRLGAMKRWARQWQWNERTVSPGGGWAFCARCRCRRPVGRRWGSGRSDP